MSDTPEGRDARKKAYGDVGHVLRAVRQRGELGWDAVLDLTRELDTWETFDSPREARAAMRRNYDEDRWWGQPYYPLLIVEKDTMEPVCKPMAMRWQMPFASSRGYSSLALQHDVAQLIVQRAHAGQTAMIYFASEWPGLAGAVGVRHAGLRRAGEVRAHRADL